MIQFSLGCVREEAETNNNTSIARYIWKTTSNRCPRDLTTTRRTFDCIKMAKRRRRKITIKNSSLFAFFALISLFLLDENSAYQHQNPYRYSAEGNNKQLLNQQQKHKYFLNQAAQSYGISAGTTIGSSGSSIGGQRDDLQLRSSQSSSFISQQNFQESSIKQHLSTSSPTTSHLYKLNAQQQQQQHHLSSLPSVQHLCSNLPSHLVRQLKLCKLISQSPNADTVVSTGASRGLAECRSQFRHDRWNCTHADGDHQLLTSELTQSIGNPESGFIHAIAAAGIVHQIAAACSAGTLSDCACDRAKVGTMPKRDEPNILFKWGGCSNNIRHGMMFAKHFVELLDAVHQHTRLVQLQQQQQHHQHQYRQQRQHHSHLSKRAATNRDHLFNQRPPSDTMQHLQAAPGESTSYSQAAIAAAAQRDFCQQNQNISQAKHHELIKSLLSRNSLEKHQEFRLAMNMHNNKIGRMAVAKNMKTKCRCHGLSGTCSLTTCFSIMPDLDVIGRYLKKKYERSVHLPRAINLNKLIPMMNRQEISAILSSSRPESPHEIVTQTPSSTTTEFISKDHWQQQQQPHRPPEFAALVQSHDNKRDGDGEGSDDGDNNDDGGGDQEQVEPPPSITGTLAPATTGYNVNSTADEHLTLYVSHRLQPQQTWPVITTTTTTTKPPLSTRAAATQQQLATNEIPNNLEPLSQQQYQALLREMRLCNTIQQTSHLQTRDLNQQHHQQQHNHHHHHQSSRRQRQQLLNGQQTKQANQQLSHLLPHNDKDELIHLHQSPKYCEADLRHGFMGIQSRICRNSENAPDSCDKLCCGRGHREVILETKVQCGCKFKFCCAIDCVTCAQKSNVLVCN